MASINAVKLSNNVFFKANARRNINGIDILMTDVVSQNILYDYSDSGIKSGNIEIFPCDIFDTKGTLKKEWNKGNVIDVNEIVKIIGKNGESTIKNKNKDILMRVVGRTFKYDGVPTIELELQEIKE